MPPLFHSVPVPNRNIKWESSHWSSAYFHQILQTDPQAIPKFDNRTLIYWIAQIAQISVQRGQQFHHGDCSDRSE
jgi:hypothetical protein